VTLFDLSRYPGDKMIKVRRPRTLSPVSGLALLHPSHPHICRPPCSFLWESVTLTDQHVGSDAISPVLGTGTLT